VSRDRLPGARVWAIGSRFATVALVFVVAAALFDWALGAVIALAAVAVTGAIHIGVGIWSYRTVMRRPWPEVRPLPDDDDW
jgi:hypothetical protein